MPIVEPNELDSPIFEPKVQFRFRLLIDGVESYYIDTAELPKLTADEIVVPRINDELYFKGKTHWEPITITLIDPIVPQAAQAIIEWVRLGHESVTARDGYADFYQKDITIHELGNTGDIIGKWVLKRAWVKDADWGSLDKNSSEVVKINVVIRYNYAIKEY